MRVLLLASAAACGLCLSSAHAAFIVNFAQVGNSVVATGSGTLSLTGLTFAGSGSAGSGVIPSQGVLGVGPTTSSADYYAGVSGPLNFGTGGPTVPTSTSGIFAGVEAAPLSFLVVPHGFVSGGSLSGTDTFANATFASLGLTPGQYTYSWNAPADSFVINIPAVAVPEPATFGVLVMGLVGLMAARRHWVG